MKLFGVTALSTHGVHHSKLGVTAAWTFKAMGERGRRETPQNPNPLPAPPGEWVRGFGRKLLSEAFCSCCRTHGSSRTIAMYLTLFTPDTLRALEEFIAPS